MKLHELGAHELIGGYRSRAISPVEVVRSVLDRIDRWEPHLHASYLLRPALALDRASEDLRAELIRRLGPSFAVADLYALYLDADSWAREVVRRALEPSSVPAALAPLIDTAFGQMASSARDRR